MITTTTPTTKSNHSFIPLLLFIISIVTLFSSSSSIIVLGQSSSSSSSSDVPLCALYINNSTKVSPGAPCGNNFTQSCPSFLDALNQCSALNQTTNMKFIVYHGTYSGPNNSAIFNFSAIAGYDGPITLQLISYWGTSYQPFVIDLANNTNPFIQAIDVDLNVYITGATFTNSNFDQLQQQQQCEGGNQAFRSGLIMNIEAESNTVNVEISGSSLEKLVTSCNPGPASLSSLFYFDVDGSTSSLSMNNVDIFNITDATTSGGTIVYSTPNGINVTLYSMTIYQVRSGGFGSFFYLPNSILNINSVVVRNSTITINAFYLSNSKGTLSYLSFYNMVSPTDSSSSSSSNGFDDIAYISALYITSGSNITMNTVSMSQSAVALMVINNYSNVTAISVSASGNYGSSIVSVYGVATFSLVKSAFYANYLTGHMITVEERSNATISQSTFNFLVPSKAEGVLLYVEDSMVYMDQIGINAQSQNYSSYIACDEESQVSVPSETSIYFQYNIFSENEPVTSCQSSILSCEVHGLEECEKEPMEFGPFEILLVVVGCIFIVIVGISIFLKLYHRYHSHHHHGQHAQYTQL